MPEVGGDRALAKAGGVIRVSNVSLRPEGCEDEKLERLRCSEGKAARVM